MQTRSSAIARTYATAQIFNARYPKLINIPNSMTVLYDLLPVALDMTAKKTTGTFNFTNPGAISHNEVMDLYKKVNLFLCHEFASLCEFYPRSAVCSTSIRHIRGRILRPRTKLRS